MRWFYVSFAGDEGFRGVVHIDASDEDAVLERTNELEVNPGGEMLILAIPDDIAEKVLAHGYARRLLSEDDLHALDRLIEGEDSPGPKRLSELTDEEHKNVASHTAGRICETHNNAIDVAPKWPTPGHQLVRVDGENVQFDPTDPEKDP
jgi:hypothetical protein